MSVDGDDPNLRRWGNAAEHVGVYRETDGAIGHIWYDRPHLLLSTTGRRSGREHTVPLVYSRLPEGDRLVVVASAGGSEHHPAWYLNLMSDARVGVQLLGERWTTTALPATGPDEVAGWQEMVRTWSGFRTYRERTRRRIPLVLLGPRPERSDALP